MKRYPALWFHALEGMCLEASRTKALIATFPFHVWGDREVHIEVVGELVMVAITSGPDDFSQDVLSALEAKEFVLEHSGPAEKDSACEWSMAVV